CPDGGSACSPRTNTRSPHPPPRLPLVPTHPAPLLQSCTRTLPYARAIRLWRVEGETVAAGTVGMRSRLGHGATGGIFCRCDNWRGGRRTGSGGSGRDANCGCRGSCNRGGNRTGQEPIGAGDAIRVGHGGSLQAAGIDEIANGVSLFGDEHGVVPDGGGSLYACHINHGSIVIIAGPDAHDIVTGVANGPVITEILCGACFSGGWSNGTT